MGPSPSVQAVSSVTRILLVLFLISFFVNTSRDISEFPQTPTTPSLAPRHADPERQSVSKVQVLETQIPAVVGSDLAHNRLSPQSLSGYNSSRREEL